MPGEHVVVPLGLLWYEHMPVHMHELDQMQCFKCKQYITLQSALTAFWNQPACPPFGSLWMGAAITSAWSGLSRNVQAFRSTDTTRWLIDRDNHCCQTTGFGCPASPTPRLRPGAALRFPSLPDPVAVCRSGTIPAYQNCSVTPKQAIAVVSLQSLIPARLLAVDLFHQKS